MSISTFKIKRSKLAPTVTVLGTYNYACTNVRAKPFYVHENRCTQILNVSSPAYALIRARTYAYQGVRNVFLEHLACFVFL